jgi:hypothetical protein
MQVLPVRLSRRALHCGALPGDSGDVDDVRDVTAGIAAGAGAGSALSWQLALAELDGATPA